MLDGLLPRVVASGLRSARESPGQIVRPDAVGEGWAPDPPTAYCGRCGATAGPGAATARGCPFCLGQPVPWDRVVRLSAYVPPVSGWIKAMKFGGQWSWGPHFGQALAQAIGPLEGGASWVVCPVPMPGARRWWRGFNQAQLVAEAMARALHLDCGDLLKRTRYTAPQTTLTRTQRQANVRGSLALRPVALRGWRVWLVDDVKTSGATLTACCRLLRDAGVAEIHVAVVAVADPSGQNFTTLQPAKTPSNNNAQDFLTRASPPSVSEKKGPDERAATAETPADQDRSEALS